MFLGTYKTLFSGKNRVILPRKFRKELEPEDILYIVRGLDGEIWGFNTADWAKEAEKRLNIPLTETKGRVLRRRFFSQAEECLLDSQGRFIISQELIDYAGLLKEILIIGAGDHLEIWEKEKYEEEVRKGFEG
jgi:MraZ protein